QEQRSYFFGFVRLKESVLLVVRMGHSRGAHRGADRSPLARVTRQDEDVATLEGAPVQSPWPRGVGHRTDFARDALPEHREPLGVGSRGQAYHVHGGDLASVPIDELA